MTACNDSDRGAMPGRVHVTRLIAVAPFAWTRGRCSVAVFASIDVAIVRCWETDDWHTGIGWTKADAERATSARAREPSVGKESWPRDQWACLAQVVHPQQLQHRVAKEEPAVRGPSSRMALARALDESVSNEDIGSRSADRGQDEEMVEFERWHARLGDAPVLLERTTAALHAKRR